MRASPPTPRPPWTSPWPPDRRLDRAARACRCPGFFTPADPATGADPRRRCRDHAGRTSAGHEPRPLYRLYDRRVDRESVRAARAAHEPLRAGVGRCQSAGQLAECCARGLWARSARDDCAACAGTSTRHHDGHRDQERDAQRGVEHREFGGAESVAGDSGIADEALMSKREVRRLKGRPGTKFCRHSPSSSNGPAGESCRPPDGHARCTGTPHH